MHTAFKGEGAADDAAGMVHKDSFLWKDFPEKDGWEHFYNASPEARQERGERVASEMCSKGTATEKVWK